MLICVIMSLLFKFFFEIFVKMMLKGGKHMNENLISDICLYIDDNVNDSISIDDIASVFHFNKFHLMRKFKECTGLTINQYINSRKIQNSMHEIAYTDDSMLKVALNNGFNSLEYFSEQFTRIVGLSPSKFRKFSLVHGSLPFEQGGKDMDKLEQIQTDLAELKELKKIISSLQSSAFENNNDKKDVKVPVKVLTRQSDKKAA